MRSFSQGTLVRVRRDFPCPVCHKFKGCSVSADGTLVLCVRTCEGARRQARNGAWVHVLGRSSPERDWSVDTRSIPVRVTPVGMMLFARECYASLDRIRLEQFSKALGVSEKSLRRLRVGWAEVSRLRAVGTPCGGNGCWTFPMRDAGHTVVGIRLRSCDGSKFACRGGHEGRRIVRHCWTLGWQPWVDRVAPGDRS
jgi:hypothetical protein